MYSVMMLCHLMQVSRPRYYGWSKRPGNVIAANEFHLYRRIKPQFKTSRDSLGSRELAKKLREEGFEIGHCHARIQMERLGLRVQLHAV
jgi:putative transposase